jgi:hypothetical protein
VEQLDRRISAESREVSEALQEFVESNTGRKMESNWSWRPGSMSAWPKANRLRRSPLHWTS